MVGCLWKHRDAYLSGMGGGGGDMQCLSFHPALFPLLPLGILTALTSTVLFTPVRTLQLFPIITDTLNNFCNHEFMIQVGLN